MVQEQLAILAATQARTDERLGQVAEQLALLTAAQIRSEVRLGNVEGRVGRVEEQLARLADAQARNEERVGRVEEQLANLAEAQSRTEHELASLATEVRKQGEQFAAALARADERLEMLSAETRRLANQLGDNTGWVWQERYRGRAPSYLAGLALRVRVLSNTEVVNVLQDAVEAGLISVDEAADARLADIVCQGRRDSSDVYLVVEASARVASSDVERAQRRADIFAKTGTPAIAVVTGQTGRVDRDARRLAEKLGVTVDER